MHIELLKIHTHAGVEHGAGTVIDVDDSTATWLIAYSVGQAVTSAEPRRSHRNEASPAPLLRSTKE